MKKQEYTIETEDGEYEVTEYDMGSIPSRTGCLLLILSALLTTAAICWLIWG